tara:strand:- start:6343 stop:6993 length:651 start_codon:yes stop_codon:yes gene_type:complete
MKLIAEYTEQDIQCTITEGKNGGKNYVIEGVFAQAEKENRNKRFYSRDVLTPAVDKFVNEQVKTKRAVGELNHPEGPTVNLDKVSHRITEMNWNGNNVMGKALVLDTPMGNIVKGLLEGGCQLGVSTRGMGSLENRNGTAYVKDDFHLATVDIVQDPSAPEAFVNGIMEGVDWVWNNGVIQPQVIEEIETEIKKAPRSDLHKIQEREFKNFLSLLK